MFIFTNFYHIYMEDNRLYSYKNLIIIKLFYSTKKLSIIQIINFRNVEIKIGV